MLLKVTATYGQTPDTKSKWHHIGNIRANTLTIAKRKASRLCRMNQKYNSIKMEIVEEPGDKNEAREFAEAPWYRSTAKHSKWT